MNARMKRRLISVSGIIVVVLIVVLAVVGSSTAAQAVTVSDVAKDQSYAGKKIQVSGNVVQDSFTTQDNVLTFSIYDPDADPNTHLAVRYEGSASSTFGNDVTAICTGRVGEDGVLAASELVTKCPSKYENATDALSIDRLLEYGQDVYGKPVKVSGAVQDGTLSPAGQGDRFVLVDSNATQTLPVVFDGALSDEVIDGTHLVLTGSMSADGRFTATDVALEG